MTQTFTPNTDLTAKNTKKEQKEDFLNFAEPSESTINTILSYSKNLEVKPSNLIKTLEFIKS